MRKYKHLDTLPIGRASDEITEGCLVLEGGAWRGLYTVGVLDAMMENDLRVSRVGKELPMSTGYMIEARDIMDVLGISKTRMLTSSPSHLI